MPDCWLEYKVVFSVFFALFLFIFRRNGKSSTSNSKKYFFFLKKMIIKKRNNKPFTAKYGSFNLFNTINKLTDWLTDWLLWNAYSRKPWRRVRKKPAKYRIWTITNRYLLYSNRFIQTDPADNTMDRLNRHTHTHKFFHRTSQKIATKKWKRKCNIFMETNNNNNYWKICMNDQRNIFVNFSYFDVNFPNMAGACAGAVRANKCARMIQTYDR